jgi:hypothetical protein
VSRVEREAAALLQSCLMWIAVSTWSKVCMHAPCSLSLVHVERLVSLDHGGR